MPIDFLLDYNDPSRSEWPAYEWKTGGWRQRQTYITIAPEHKGKMVRAFQVESGDVLSGASGERVEGKWDASDEHLMDGNGVWKYYGWACFVPEDWQAPGGFAHPFQWHNTASFSQPPIKFDFAHNGAEDITISFNTGLESAGPTWDYNQRHTLYSSLSKGVRQNFIIGALWDRTANGAFKVWHCVEGTDKNFVLRLDLSSIPTLTYLSPSNVGNIYLKNGLYRTASAFTNIIYHYLLARGDSYSEIRSLFRIPPVVDSHSTVDAHLDVAIPGSPACYPGLVYPDYTPSFEHDTLTVGSSSKGSLSPTTSTKGTLT